MLTPQDLSNIPNNIVELYSSLESFIIADYARRLKKVGEITSTAQWQAERAKIIGIKNVESKVASILKLTDTEIESLFKQAAKVSFKAEAIIYENAKLNTIDYKSDFIQSYIKAAIRQTKGDIENITQSLGFAEMQNGRIVYKPIAKFYQEQLNLTHLKVIGGVQDYNTAIKQAVKKLTDSGLRTIDYEGNWSNQVDVSVRRAVLTGVQQMSQQMTDANIEKIIPNEDERYVEVTAHENARDTGTGIENHKAWQGKVYKLKGSTKEYPNLVEKTGLGDIKGLKGANCRHSYYPFIPGVSVRAYTDEQLNNIDPKPFGYKGKTYTAYEASQYQRKIETAMRQTKRELIAYKEAGLDGDFKKASILLQQQKKEYKQFSKAAGLREKLERSTVVGFNRSISQQAVSASKKK